MTRTLCFITALGFAMPCYAQTQILDGVSVGVSVEVRGTIMTSVEGYEIKVGGQENTEFFLTITDEGYIINY